jgi:Domain of unknown function (DUF4831)
LQLLFDADVDFREIYALTTRRKDLIGKDSIIQSEGVLKTMLSEIDAVLKPLLEKFLGSTGVDAAYFSGSFDVIVRSTTPGVYSQSIELFSLDAAGPCNIAATNSSDYSVRPVMSFPARRCEKATSKIRMEISAASHSDYSAVVSTFRGNIPEAPENGLVYRIPASADIRIMSDTKELKSGQFPIAQLGTTAFLPNTTGGRKTQYVTELSPATGAIKNIMIGQEALLNAGMVEGVGSAVKSLQDAKAASAPKAPATQRELDEEAFRAARAKACLADPLNSECANIR